MGWLTSVIAGAFTYFGARSEESANRRATTLANREEYNWSTRTSAFDAALADYYKQRDKNEARKASKEYSKFSNLSSWAPGYTNTYQPPATPNLPTPEEIANKNPGAK